MSEQVTFTIDGKKCTAAKGQTLVAAAKENGIYIPTLCDFEGLSPAATCRICTVKINGRPITACTTTVTQGMVVENDTEELGNIRKAIIEMLFVEGNHFCPACEKSGNCELQALGYRYQMMVPRYPYSFAQKPIDAATPKLIVDSNRCILCKRCVRGVENRDAKKIFAIAKRGNKAQIKMDHTLAATLSDEEAKAAMDMCPVGAIIKKEVGFSVPIGKRKFDSQPIGSDIEAHTR